MIIFKFRHSLHTGLTKKLIKESRAMINHEYNTDEHNEKHFIHIRTKSKYGKNVFGNFFCNTETCFSRDLISSKQIIFSWVSLLQEGVFCVCVYESKLECCLKECVCVCVCKSKRERQHKCTILCVCVLERVCGCFAMNQRSDWLMFHLRKLFSTICFCCCCCCCCCCPIRVEA
jgi:hypothetical protein